MSCSPLESDVAERARILRRRRGKRAGGGPQGIARQQVEDVRQDEFLVLLLVVKPEVDQGGGPRSDLSSGPLEHPPNRRGHMAAIAVNPIQAGARQNPLSGLGWRDPTAA